MKDTSLSETGTVKKKETKQNETDKQTNKLRLIRGSCSFTYPYIVK